MRVFFINLWALHTLRGISMYLTNVNAAGGNGEEPRRHHQRARSDSWTTTDDENLFSKETNGR